MQVNPNIFRAYDLRGLVGKELSPELSEHLGKAFGTMLKRDGIHEAVVGRDSRETGPEYSNRLIKGLSWAGIDVVDIGMTMVGTFYWSQHFLKRRGGVYVSASHNPPEYNGYKFANDYSETLVSDGMAELRRLVETEEYEEGDSPGKVTQIDVLPDYATDLVKRLPLDRKLKVLVDGSNTVGGQIVPYILKTAGAEVIEKHTEVDPTFPLGVANPIEDKVMERVSKETTTAGADVGTTYDADGDRIGIVDEKGNKILNDVLVALMAVDVLADHPGATIMFNTLCSKVVSETILANGGKPFMWRTGHSFLKKKNQEIKAAYIGELSGHFFFSADFYNHDDGAYSTMRVLRFLSRNEKPLSELIAELPHYISSPEISVYCADEKKAELMGKIAPILKKDFPDAEIIDDERAGDGVRLEMPDRMFIVRYSQNGPYITMKFEAKKQEDYEDLRKYIYSLLKQFKEIDWGADINTNLEYLQG